MFWCPRWAEERNELRKLVPDFAPNEQLLANPSATKESWKAFQTFAEVVMISKEEEERRIEARVREERRQAQARRCSVM